MPAQTTTYGDIGTRSGIALEKKFLKRSQNFLTIERFGQVSVQERNKGQTRKFREIKSLSITNALTPAVEGVAPDGQKLQTRDVSVTLEQYIDLVRTTDKIDDIHEDGKALLSELNDLCAEQAALVIEMVRYAVLKAGTNVYYASAVADRNSVNKTITLGDVRRIERGFMRYGAQPISKVITPSANYGTDPVAPAFFAIAHTDLASDIRGITGFVPVEKYSANDKALPGEIGKVETTRFICSRNFNPWLKAGASGTTFLSDGGIPSEAGKCDVYPVLFFAQNAFGIVPLQGLGSIELKVRKVGTVDSYDPVGQTGSVGWKTWQGCVILNDLFMARLEVAATAKPE